MLSVGAVSSNLNIVAQSANYTAAANDFVMVNATAGPVTITMPASPGKNTLVAVKKADASTNMVAIVPGTGALLNGDTAAGLVAGGASVTFQFDGVDWQMVSTGAVNAANAAAGIPTGGTSGQLLTKNSASNYDATWTTPAAAASYGSAAVLPWGSGKTMTQPAYTTQQTTWPVGNTSLTMFVPLRIPNACTINYMGFCIQSSSGAGTAYLALYTDIPNATGGGPGTRLTGSQVGTGGSSTVQTPFLNCIITAPTTVWAAFAWSVGGTFVGTATSNFSNVVLGGYTAAASNNNARYTTSYYATSVPPVDMTTTTTTPLNMAVPLFLFVTA